LLLTWCFPERGGRENIVYGRGGGGEEEEGKRIRGRGGGEEEEVERRRARGGEEEEEMILRCSGVFLGSLTARGLFGFRVQDLGFRV